jgi:hypothetical protein
VIVPFDPLTDPVSLARFRAAYGNHGTVVGPYSGDLRNQGDSVELQRPDSPQSPPAPDAGFVPYLRVEKVDCSFLPPWPTNTTAGVASLQRVDATAYGNEPGNWISAAPSAGLPTGSSGPDDAPALTITELTPDRVTFQFTALAGHTYSLLYRENLTGGPWLKIADVPDPGADQTVTVVDPTPSATGRFYLLTTPASP